MEAGDLEGADIWPGQGARSGVPAWPAPDPPPGTCAPGRSGGRSHTLPMHSTTAAARAAASGHPRPSRRGFATFLRMAFLGYRSKSLAICE